MDDKGLRAVGASLKHSAGKNICTLALADKQNKGKEQDRGCCIVKGEGSLGPESRPSEKDVEPMFCVQLLSVSALPVLSHQHNYHHTKISVLFYEWKLSERTSN